MQMITDKMKGFLLASIAVLVLLTGCSGYRDIRVGTCTLESISPVGLKAVDAGFSVQVSNPVNDITISETEGMVYFDGEPLVSFVAPDVTVPGKSSSDVSVVLRATLAGSVNIMQIMSMVSSFRPEQLTMDISMKIRVKGGLKKKISLKEVPVESFFRKVNYESI